MRATESSNPPSHAGSSVRVWGDGTYKLGAGVLAAALAYFAYTSEVRDPVHLPIGLAILFLAGLPSLLWAKRGQPTLPIFEVLLLTTANAYAFPLLNGHQELIYYANEDVTTAGCAVLVFQLAAIVVYEFTRGRPSRHAFWREEVLTGQMANWLMYGMALNTAFVIASTFTDVVPEQLRSILRAIFFGIGIASTFIASRRLGTGELSPGERLFFGANLLVQCIAMVATLFLVGTVSLLLLALVGYVSSSGRVPLVACGVGLLLIAVLHNGKPEMRAQYWVGGERRVPTLSELPAFLTEWIQHGIHFDGADENQGATAKLIERTSLFHILSLVVSASPSQQPFLDGETYRDIPAQFVPRILWPEKPLGHVSTSRLSVYYGLQSEEDTQKTTIGFGMVAEGYANFGFLGVAAIGSLLGFFIKKVKCLALESPIFSYGGLLLILLLAWSFQVEFTLSIWLASLYQACMAVLVVPFILRRVLG